MSPGLENKASFGRAFSARTRASEAFDQSLAFFYGNSTSQMKLIERANERMKNKAFENDTFPQSVAHCRGPRG